MFLEHSSHSYGWWRWFMRDWMTIECREKMSQKGGIWNLPSLNQSFLSFHSSIFRSHVQSSFLAGLACFGFSSSILLIKSGFSRHPSHVSSQSLRIFLRSFTLSFFRSTVSKSICLSKRWSYIKWVYPHSCTKFLCWQQQQPTVFEITNLIVFLLEFFTDFVGGHRPTQWFRHFT